MNVNVTVELEIILGVFDMPNNYMEGSGSATIK